MYPECRKWLGSPAAGCGNLTDADATVKRPSLGDRICMHTRARGEIDVRRRGDRYGLSHQSRRDSPLVAVRALHSSHARKSSSPLRCRRRV